jgi:hypothetical protein
MQQPQLFVQQPQLLPLLAASLPQNIPGLRHGPSPGSKKVSTTMDIPSVLFISIGQSWSHFGEWGDSPWDTKLLEERHWYVRTYVVLRNYYVHR